MILKALCDLYDMLASNPKSGVALPNYSSIPCSHAVVISKSGEFRGVITLIEDKKRKNLIVPEQKGRSGSNPPPYFLCDNSKYILGFEYDKKSKTLIPTTERLVATYTYYSEISKGSNDEGLLAVTAFLKDRVDGKLLDISENDDVYKGGNIVFRLEDGGYVQDRPEVRAVWEKYCSENTSPEIVGQCLITGETNQPIARTHTMLKGVVGAKASGCSLVGFNLDSVSSYGKSQSYNAPVSEKAMFKYTTALNYLLNDSDSRTRLGDSTVVFWAMSSGKEQNIMSLFLGDGFEQKDSRNALVEQELMDILKNVRDGKPVVGISSPNTKTYILGLAPNAARASVRFWYESSFSDFVKRMAENQENLRVVKSDKVKKFISITQILRSITPKTKVWYENVPASYENALFRAVVSGAPYPQSVYTAVLMRIRAEGGDDFCVDYVRAGLIKAVLIRNFHVEDLTVSLNENSNDTAYNLGRLFAVMEALQAKANGTSNIRSRYFASASVNPKLVFPSLLNLAQHHVAKSEAGMYYDKMIEMIISRISEFPANLSLEDQGKFVLGYYHQREFIYTKKEDRAKLEV